MSAPGAAACSTPGCGHEQFRHRGGRGRCGGVGEFGFCRCTIFAPPMPSADPAPEPQPATGGWSQQAADLETRLAALEQRVGAVEALPSVATELAPVAVKPAT